MLKNQGGNVTFWEVFTVCFTGKNQRYYKIFSQCIACLKAALVKKELITFFKNAEKNHSEHFLLIVQVSRFKALLVARCWTKLNQLLVDEGVF